MTEESRLGVDDAAADHSRVWCATTVYVPNSFLNCQRHELKIFAREKAFLFLGQWRSSSL